MARDGRPSGWAYVAAMLLLGVPLVTGALLVLAHVHAPARDTSGPAGRGAPGAAAPSLRTAARCAFAPGPDGRGTLTLTCDVESLADVAIRATLVPVVHRGGVAERVHSEEVVLGPRQRVARTYALRDRTRETAGDRCTCEATATAE